MSANVNMIDLGAQLLVNNFATGRAVASGTLRDPLMKDRDSVWTDKRFAVGVLSTAINLFSKNAMVQRVSFDAGSASLHSLVATENVRRATVARASQLAAPDAAAVRQIPAAVNAAPIGAPVKLGFGFGSVW
jgi:hypothetical protein